MMRLPFEEALGPALERASPAVRAHFTQAPGARRVHGVMRRIWRRRDGWRGLLVVMLLRIAARLRTLFPDTGSDVPFEMVNRVEPLPDGRCTMSWARRFYLAGRTRRFEATMMFDAARGVVVDWLGTKGRLETELHACVERGALRLRSGRQWLRIGRLRWRLPRWLGAEARIRVWERRGGALGVRVTVRNPILGDFFGYAGSCCEDSSSPAAPSADRLEGSGDPPRQRLAAARPAAIALGVAGGTLLWARSFQIAGGDARTSAIAGAIAIAAACAWPAFGVALLAVTRCRPSAGAWIDVCLTTSAVGIAFLSAGALANILSPAGGPGMAAHVATLAGSSTAMACVFLPRARRLGLSLRAAAGLWLFVLHGVFAVVLAGMLGWGAAGG
jgi:hypothetical protein